MTAPEHRRWPIQPLLDLPNITTRSLRQALHMSGTNWQAAVEHGLTDPQADRAAIRHGRHPANIWPDWAEAALRQPGCDHCPHRAEADHWRHIANERQAALDRYAAIAPIPDPIPDDEGD